jgi:AcrR family transcriptional regulator
MTSTLRERRRQLLRDEILSAAHDLAAEKGYALMSMDELAARVGISKPTLYTHFATKEDLVVDAMMRDAGILLDVINDADADLTPLQRLIAVLQRTIHLQVDQGTLALRPWTPEMFQILCQRPEALDVLRRIDVGISNLVRAAVSNGEIAASLDPAMVVRSFYALAGAIYVGHFSNIGHPDPRRVADTLTNIFLSGVQQQAPTPGPDS